MKKYKCETCKYNETCIIHDTHDEQCEYEYDKSLKNKRGNEMRLNAYQEYLIIRGFLSEKFFGYEDEVDEILVFLVDLYRLAELGEEAEKERR